MSSCLGGGGAMGKLSASEKEKTKLRERTRRSITTKIFHGLRKYGGYNLAPRADINEVLRCLASEAGWVVEDDGTTYRSSGSQASSSRKMMMMSGGGGVARSCFSPGGSLQQQDSFTANTATTNNNYSSSNGGRMLLMMQPQHSVDAAAAAPPPASASAPASAGRGKLPAHSSSHGDGAAAAAASYGDATVSSALIPPESSSLQRSLQQEYEASLSGALIFDRRHNHNHNPNPSPNPNPNPNTCSDGCELPNNLQLLPPSASMQLQLQLQIQMMMEEAASRGGDCSTTASPRHAPNRHSFSAGAHRNSNSTNTPLLSHGYGDAAGSAMQPSFFSPASYSTPTSSISCLPSPSPFASPAASREIYPSSTSRGHNSLHASPAPSANIASASAAPGACGAAAAGDLAGYSISPPSSQLNSRAINGPIFCATDDSLAAAAAASNTPASIAKDELLTALPLGSNPFYGAGHNPSSHACTDDQSLLLAAAAAATMAASRQGYGIDDDVEHAPGNRSTMHLEDQILHRNHHLLLLQQQQQQQLQEQNDSSIFMPNPNTDIAMGRQLSYASDPSYGHGASDYPASSVLLMMQQHQQMYSPYNPPQFNSQPHMFLQEARASNTNTPLGSPQRNGTQ